MKLKNDFKAIRNLKLKIDFKAILGRQSHFTFQIKIFSRNTRPHLRKNTQSIQAFFYPIDTLLNTHPLTMRRLACGCGEPCFVLSETSQIIVTKIAQICNKLRFPKLRTRPAKPEIVTKLLHQRKFFMNSL